MTKITIPYFSASGYTKQLACLMSEVINQNENGTCSLIQIKPEQIVSGRYVNEKALSEIVSADAIIFGTPTYMGGVAAQFKAFIDATSELWTSQALAGKIAAGFTCGSAPNGDQSSTLQYLALLASQHGMIWVSLDKAHGYSDGVNRLGCQLGCAAYIENEIIHEDDLATATYLASRVTRYASYLKQKR